MKKIMKYIITIEDTCEKCPYLDKVIQERRSDDPFNIQFYCLHPDNRKLLKSFFGDYSSWDNPFIPESCPLEDYI